tara:strand:- start:592 stop:708 length:117 start_codon:yes stop_codon:yes gene_type:complete
LIDPGGVLFLILYPCSLALLVAVIAGEFKQTSGDYDND